MNGGNIPDDEAVRLHQRLAEYHEQIARGAILDIIGEHHRDLAERLAEEAKRIPERTESRQRMEARYAETKAKPA